MKEKFTAAHVRQIMRKRFCQPAWTILFEVIDATGARHTRSADAIAMSTWPSRGLSLHGFEIKVSRYDWQKELRDPAKAQAIQGYCDHWWIVAPDGVVQPGELPEAWGHYVVDGKGMRVVREAPRNENTKPIDRMFLASLLRNAGKVDAEELAAKAEEALAAERADIEAEIRKGVEYRTQYSASLASVVEKFEKESGLKLSSGWESLDLGPMVKLARAIGQTGYGSVAKMAFDMRAKATEMEAALKEIGVEPYAPRGTK